MTVNPLAATLACVTLAASLQAYAQQDLRISRYADQPAAVGASANFTGRVRVESPFRGESPARVGGALVTFEAGAHTAWHTHPLGQTLVVTQGAGLVQAWGGATQKIGPGDVVWIPPGVKHWHGASPSTGMSHVAIAEQLDGKSVDWLEKVATSDYPGDVPTAPAAPAARSEPASAPSRAQALFGDVNPKLAQLTDDVLFGDVWARPGLSRRDRSLATVSALVAMNRPDQLRSHLQLARANGLTESELIEAITHLAFYTGWPSAITASIVAREVFKQN